MKHEAFSGIFYHANNRFALNNKLIGDVNAMPPVALQYESLAEIKEQNPSNAAKSCNILEIRLLQ